jgi:hypothetical protein
VILTSLSLPHTHTFPLFLSLVNFPFIHYNLIYTFRAASTRLSLSLSL